jgi:hypothetical protein
MRCPHCGHERSRVMETRAGDDADRRIRMCRKCGRHFSTLERVAIYAGRENGGYVEVAQLPSLQVVPPLPEQPQTAKVTKAARYQALQDEPSLEGICLPVCDLLVQWWNESRWSKHKGKATWTRAAWEASVRRVAALPPALQRQLAEAGVEHGWQSLKVEYLDRSAKAAAAGPHPMPTDPAMREALASW